MRRLLDSLIAILVLSLIAGVVLYHRLPDRQAQSVEAAADALVQLQKRTLYQAALAASNHEDTSHIDEETGLPRRFFPQRIKLDWFADEELPVNDLVPCEHPWLDMAPNGDREKHPPDPVILYPHQAGFWYNPNNGTIRARVMPQTTDAATLELYNQVNGTALTKLPMTADERRTPIATETMPQVATAGAPLDANPQTGPPSRLRQSSGQSDSSIAPAVRQTASPAGSQLDLETVIQQAVTATKRRTQTPSDPSQVMVAPQFDPDLVTDLIQPTGGGSPTSSSDERSRETLRK